MKKYRNMLLTLFISLGIMLGIPNVYADDIPDVDDVNLSKVSVGDKFMVGTTTYKVTEVEKDEIYVGSIKNKNKLGMYHFEIDAYESGSDTSFTSRKFVKLEDLCYETYTESGETLNICEVKKYKNKDIGDTINVQRQYVKTIKDTISEMNEYGGMDFEEINREVYYSTDHTLGTDEFQSLLYVDNGKGSTLETDDDLDEEERGNFYYFGDIESDEVENERFNESGVLTGDVETLIDSNGDIYISLRFLSEALGARVDWLAQQINNDTDAVLIRFYDSESYCKEFNVNFTEYNKDFAGMYEKFLNEIKGENNDLSFDLSYTYRSSNGTENGKAKWNKLFLGGYAAKNGYVGWLDGKVHFYNDSSMSENEKEEFFQEICPSENYKNGQLTTLDGCIEVMGLIRYYGVPVPINLLRQENDTCTFDENNFEKDNNYYDNGDENSDSDYDYGSGEYDGYDAIVIGDAHVENISKIYDDENIKYIIVDDVNDFEDTLNEISENLNDDEKYKLIFHMGNNEIFDIEYSDKTDDEKQEKVSNLAKTYANIYSKFLEKVDKNNVSKYIVENTPNQNGWDLTVKFYGELSLNLKYDDLNYINDNDKLYCSLSTGYKYDDGAISNIEYGGDVIRFTGKMTYNDATYKNLVNSISDCVDVDFSK